MRPVCCLLVRILPGRCLLGISACALHTDHTLGLIYIVLARRLRLAIHCGWLRRHSLHGLANVRLLWCHSLHGLTAVRLLRCLSLHGLAAIRLLRRHSLYGLTNICLL